jgi:hypothetical protein
MAQGPLAPSKCANQETPCGLCNLITLVLFLCYHILLSIVHTFYIENDAEIFPSHNTWKVAERGFKMAFMMNKLAMINSCEIFL